MASLNKEYTFMNEEYDDDEECQIDNIYSFSFVVQKDLIFNELISLET